MYISYPTTFAFACIAGLFAVGTYLARFCLFDYLQTSSYYGLTIRLIEFSIALIGFSQFFIGWKAKKDGRPAEVIKTNISIGLFCLIVGVLSLLNSVETLNTGRTWLAVIFPLLATSTAGLIGSAEIKKRGSTVA